MARKKRWADPSSHSRKKRNDRISIAGNIQGAQSHLGTSYKERLCFSVEYSRNYAEPNKKQPEDLLFLGQEGHQESDVWRKTLASIRMVPQTLFIP